MPRLSQRLVRRNAIQSVHVVQAAADHRADDTTNCAPDSTANRSCTPQLRLRGLGASIVGVSLPRATRRYPGSGRLGWRILGVVSVWHGSFS
jgi:hypothetical protein